MKLEDLRFFTRVVALGNLSAAGREFGLSPSAASARLTALETGAGSQLLARTTRKVSLTEAGQVFIEHANRALSEMDAAMSALEASTEAPRGTLRITSNVSFVRKHVLPYLNEFKSEYPDVRIEMNITDRIVDIVEEGYDLAIRVAELPDSALKARKLAENPRYLCASPDYIARHGEPTSPADLANHECLGFEPMPAWYFAGPNGEVAHHVHSAISSDNGDFTHEAAIHGLGLTVKSIAHIWEDLREGRLVVVMRDYPVTRAGAVWAVYPPGKQTPPKVTAFIDFLQKKFGRPAYWEADFRQE
ncbi:LysR family transcriptional regulator [Rhizobiales bacterium]|uniref:LysR family transcriptional regulator n=1 Tax=Hongsoonwoonella zoysiae TaxID=2821844 RepID=UPI00155FBBD5|nr:LysR family transcriptional regulator [Hongsoonwoonella zoysiae]NRG19040.1 LysR family transcriptional regulator [Hongsoonwoonella zoysiae]